PWTRRLSRSVRFLWRGSEPTLLHCRGRERSRSENARIAPRTPFAPVPFHNRGAPARMWKRSPLETISSKRRGGENHRNEFLGGSAPLRAPSQRRIRCRQVSTK